MRTHSKLFIAAALAFSAGTATYTGAKSFIHSINDPIYSAEGDLQITKTGVVIELDKNLLSTRIYDFKDKTVRQGIFLQKLEDLTYSDILRSQLVRRRACQTVQREFRETKYTALCVGMVIEPS